MKKIDFKNKKTTWWLIGLLIIVLLIIFFIKGIEGKSLKNIFRSNDSSMIDIANSKDYSKYEGEVFASFEGNHPLEFSFLHNNIFSIVQGKGNQSKWFKLTDASSTNLVTLYFTYEGGRGYSAEDYVNEVLKTNASVTVENVKFVDNQNVDIKYIIDEANNVEYYVEAVKGVDGDPWLAIVENKAADNETLKSAAKDLMRSLEIASAKEEVITETPAKDETETDTATETPVLESAE